MCLKYKKIIIISFNISNNSKEKLIINNLLKNKIVSCINVIKNINSYYYWNNKIKNKKENKIIIKTLLDCEKKVKKIIYKYHPYKIPEILILNKLNINKKYLNWMINNIIT